MATRAIRLKFTQEDLNDPKVRSAARKAGAAADRADRAMDALPRKSKLHKEREFAANTLRKERRVADAEPASADKTLRRRQVQEAGREQAADAARTTKLRFAEEDMKKPAGSRHTVTRAVSGAVKDNIDRNNQDENTGVQSAQFLEDSAEQTLHAVDHASYGRRLKRYANAERLSARSDAANIEALYQKAVKDHPEAASNPVSRWMQRQAVKRQYAAMKAGQAAADTAETAVAGSNVVNTAADWGLRLLRYAKSNTQLLLPILAFAMLLLTISGTVSSCSYMAAGLSNTILVTSFTAETEDILGAEADYLAKEEALRTRLAQLQEQGNYDEYRVSADEIGHDPYELAALLTVLREDYTRSEVQGLLRQIFDLQYSLTSNSSTETSTQTRTVQVGESLGTVTTSAYCSCSICCGKWAGGPTASGVYPKANHTLAVDASDPFVPIGTKVIMNGIEYTVEDTGNFARYGVQFDVYYDSHQAALQHGHQDWECYLADSSGTNSIQVTTTETRSICNITLTNRTLRSVLSSLNLTADQLERFELLLETKGNREDLFTE